MIDEIREYFLKCPILDELGRLEVDYLDNKANNYSIEPIPSGETIKTYTDGATLNQFDFVIASREFYGENINIDNTKFYEKFKKWIEEQNKKGNIPELDYGMISNKLEVMTSGYLFSATSDTARYQIQLKLIYYKEY